MVGHGGMIDLFEDRCITPVMIGDIRWTYSELELSDQKLKTRTAGSFV